MRRTLISIVGGVLTSLALAWGIDSNVANAQDTLRHSQQKRFEEFYKNGRDKYPLGTYTDLRGGFHLGPFSCYPVKRDVDGKEEILGYDFNCNFKNLFREFRKRVFSCKEKPYWEGQGNLVSPEDVPANVLLGPVEYTAPSRLYDVPQSKRCLKSKEPTYAPRGRVFNSAIAPLFDGDPSRHSKIFR